MIRHITGTVTDVHPTHVVVDVQGIGYLLFISTRTVCMPGTKTKLYTHLAVRENALDLYGFPNPEELSLFELLLTLPKIGPKSALQILSQADSELLRTCIANDDAAQLSKLSGMSKKTAEKIVLGLKDAFEDSAYTYAPKTEAQSDTQNALMHDAIDALISLGYPHADARKAIQQLAAQKPPIANVNDAIKEALKMLG